MNGPEERNEEKWEEKAARRREEKYLLHLYVAGLSQLSRNAIDNIRAICREHLDGRYELQIRDIYQDPAGMKKDNVIAAPVLIKKLPPPPRKFVGDLSNIEELLVGLEIKKRTEPP